MSFTEKTHKKMVGTAKEILEAGHTPWYKPLTEFDIKCYEMLADIENRRAREIFVEVEKEFEELELEGLEDFYPKEIYDIEDTDALIKSLFIRKHEKDDEAFFSTGGHIDEIRKRIQKKKGSK